MQEFSPDLSPQEMLELGVFGGTYFDVEERKEFPAEWFVEARLSEKGYDESLNFFGVNASQSHREWLEKGWINLDYDPLGWFQWYCRYYQGRRVPHEDERQQKRWHAMRRHVSQVQKNCMVGDINCRKKQRQALLHWGYDSRLL